MLESKHWFLNPHILDQLAEISSDHLLDWDEFVTTVAELGQTIITTAPHGFLSFQILFLNKFGRQPDRRLRNTKHQIDSYEWDHPQGHTFQLFLNPQGKAFDAHLRIIKPPPPPDKNPSPPTPNQPQLF